MVNFGQKYKLSMIDFKDVKALTFDCYGTLIDWESGIISTLRGLHSDLEPDDEHLLSMFATHEHKVQELNPSLLYTGVLEEVYRKIMNDLYLPTAKEKAKIFASSAGTWPPFTDTVEALQRLSGRFRLVIVSNIDLTSVSRTLTLLNVPFHRVYTAQEMGFYKPDPGVFEYVLQSMHSEGISRDEVVHVAQSLYHDHIPAAAIGLKRVWINRRWNKKGQGATPAVSDEFIPHDIYPDLSTFATSACRQ